MNPKTHEFFNKDFKKIITKVKKIAGWREKNILENLYNIETIQDGANYKVYRFFAPDTTENGRFNTFDYEVKSNRITG